jgi:hypothetical protein
MKRILAVAGASAVLGATSVAVAANDHSHLNAFVLRAGQAVAYGGLTCTAYAGTTATNADIVCVRNNLRGFGVIVSQQTIIIAKRSGSSTKVVFKTTNG